MGVRRILPISFLVLACVATMEGRQENRGHPVVAGFERFGADDPVEGGRLLLGELNCVSCHKPDAAAVEQVNVKRAPILTEAGSRLTADGLSRRAVSPSGSSRRS